MSDIIVAQKCVPVLDINWRLNVNVYEKLNDLKRSCVRYQKTLKKILCQIFDDA